MAPENHLEAPLERPEHDEVPSHTFHGILMLFTIALCFTAQTMTLRVKPNPRSAASLDHSVPSQQFWLQPLFAAEEFHVFHFSIPVEVHRSHRSAGTARELKYVRVDVNDEPRRMLWLADIFENVGLSVGLGV